MNDPVREVRERAVEALAALKSGAAVLSLVAQLKDDDMRIPAAWALGEIGDQRG